MRSYSYRCLGPYFYFCRFCQFTQQPFESTHDCIYNTAPFVSTMATGSTGTYRSLEGEAPEMTTMLAKKEPEVDASGSSYNTPDWWGSQRLSPQRDLFNSSPCHSPCLSSDSYCLFGSIQVEQPSDETTAGVSVPARALTDKIIRLYLSPLITNITQIVVLSNTDFLIYKGRWSKEKEWLTMKLPHIPGVW